MRRDWSLFIVTLGAVLVNICSCNAQSFARSSEDEPLRMASDSLVVKSYRDNEEENAPAEEVDYRSYQGVMGRPGIDFPVLRNIPATDFNCRDVKRPGYYADLATDCQVFHICDGGRKISFLCPNGTIFRQSHLICDWWFRVDCGKSVELYEESAEQLAADQKIYRARSIERERRRKQGKSAENDEDTSGGEVYAQEDQFETRSRTRNSKKVIDSKSAEKFPNYYRGGKDELRRPVEQKTNNNNNNRGFNNNNNNQAFQNANANFQTPKPYTPEPNTYTTASTFKFRTFDNNNNLNRQQPRENIQGAESGSLVGNLRNVGRYDNSLSYDAKLPEYKFRQSTSTTTTTTTTTVKPFTFRSTTEPRQFRTTSSPTSVTTPRSDTSRRFFEADIPVRNQNLIRTTPKYVSTEKTPAVIKFISTTERKPYSSPAPVSSTPGPFFHLEQQAQTTASPLNLRKSTEFERSYPTEKTPADTLYYATFSPEKNDDVTTTPRNLHVSLGQLNINRPTPEPEIDAKSYEDEIREGLDIPPSSGPNALRSFALYFAGKSADSSKRGNPDEAKDLFYIPTVQETEPTFEDKKKEVVQRVDTIIKDSAGTAREELDASSALPNSLTQQTKDSFSALFDKNRTETERINPPVTESEYGTTAIDDYTEDIEKINIELKKNDLDGSQSRGLVEPDDGNGNILLDEEFSKVSPDLRELAQVFTKALSAYLDDPEAFRKVLSEVRPTEPSATEETTSADYPSVTQEDDEVLDFSDVTKVSNRRRTTTIAYKETTTEYVTEPPTTTTTTAADIDNFVVALSVRQNQSYVKVPDIELTAPLVESLDESQSSYYTPPPSVVATTNAIAEEINSEFSGSETLPDVDSNEAVDSYLPIRGSVDDKTRPRYGGFQNNTNYSPYGAELSTKPYSPYGAELTTIAPVTREPEVDVATTFNPRNISSSILFRKKPEAVVKKPVGEEASLAAQLNNLAETDEDKTLIIVPPVPEFESIKLGNGETIERTRTRSTTARSIVVVPQTTQAPHQPRELSIELSPPFDTEPSSESFYEIESNVNNAPPQEEYRTTTGFPTTVTEHIAETFPPTSFVAYESSTTVGYSSSPIPVTEDSPTFQPETTPKSFERIAELQQTLMFNTNNVTHQQMERARITVAEAVDNMTDSTAHTLMKMMEMAAKNETYRRLVLLLVNDKSGKNKTVEETRLALLRALLTPVIRPSRSRFSENEQLATTTTTTTTPEPTTTTTTTTTPAPTTTTTPGATTIRDGKRRGHFRRSKSINGETRNVVRITTEPPKERAKNGRRTKTRVVSRIVKTTEVPNAANSVNRLSNLELISRTIENSKAKEIKNNSLEDAILDSDSRAVELLRSLYSLAARWG